MSNDTATARPTFYAVAVKGANGRKWFAADSSRCGDRAFVQTLCDANVAAYPELRFQVMDESLIGPLAPIKYRPWADHSLDVDDEDVNLDELDESEL